MTMTFFYSYCIDFYIHLIAASFVFLIGTNKQLNYLEYLQGESFVLTFFDKNCEEKKNSFNLFFSKFEQQQQKKYRKHSKFSINQLENKLYMFD